MLPRRRKAQRTPTDRAQASLVRRLRRWLALPRVRAAMLTEERLVGLRGSVFDVAEVDYALFLAREYARPATSIGDALAGEMAGEPGAMELTRLLRDVRVRASLDDTDPLPPFPADRGSVARMFPATVRLANSDGDTETTWAAMPRDPHVYNGGSGDGSSRMVLWDDLLQLPPLPDD